MEKNSRGQEEGSPWLNKAETRGRKGGVVQRDIQMGQEDGSV